MKEWTMQTNTILLYQNVIIFYNALAIQLKTDYVICKSMRLQVIIRGNQCRRLKIDLR